MKVYLDGKFVDESEAKISVFDHGLLYGDGVFEGISFYNGKIFKHKEHIKRLYESAKSICLDIPITEQEMMESVRNTVKINNLKNGYIRLIITRGIGGLGLNPFLCKKSFIIIIANKIALYDDKYYNEGLKVITSSTRRQSIASLSPQIKSLNYLNNILAKIDAIKSGHNEALMLNEHGYVAECTGDNIFILKDKILYTPTISSGALNGITRKVVIDIAKEIGIPCKETTIIKNDIYCADECFLTGTAAEIIPVISLDSRTINNGEVGKTTKQISEKYKKLINHQGDEIYS